MELYGREPLELGTEISTQLVDCFDAAKVIGMRTLRFDELVSSGGSCLVYRGELIETSGETDTRIPVLIKECYPPYYKCMLRRDGVYLEPEKESEREYYDALKENFIAEQQVVSRFYRETNQKDIFLAQELNNTIYIISLYGKGRTLDKFGRSELNPEKISRIMYSLCENLYKLHTLKSGAYLYLDCKPENIFCEDDGGVFINEKRTKVSLFDFDTAVPLEVIKMNAYKTVSGSEGWAAPEQIIVEGKNGKQYNDPTKINKKTDIFSAGAVFYMLLTGEKIKFSKTDRDDLDRISNRIFPWADENIKDEKERELVKKILGASLAYDNDDRRYESFRQMMEDFEELIVLTEGSLRDRQSIYAELREINKKFDSISNILPIDLEKNNSSNMDFIDEAVQPDDKTEETTVKEDWYEGETENGVPSGQGVFYLANGGRYEGTFKDGKPFGKATYYFDNSSVKEKLEGEFNGFQMPSYGVLYYRNGTVYTGELETSTPNGQGVMSFLHGELLDGFFKNGKMEGYGIAYHNNGDIFIGEFKNGKYYKGTYYFREKQCYSRGMYDEDGLQTGKCTSYYSNGYIFEGTHIKDKLNGHAVATDAKGNAKDCYYLDDTLVDNEMFDTTDLDDPMFQILKAENYLQAIKKKHYSFTTKSIVIKACSSIEKVLSSEEGKTQLLQRAESIKRDLDICMGEYKNEAIRSGDISLYQVMDEIRAVIDCINNCRENIYEIVPAGRRLNDNLNFIGYPTFNSIKNNPIIGDESRFVHLRKHGEKEFDPDLSEIFPGEQYDVRIYYFNDASETLSSLISCAKNVRLSSGFPGVLRKDKKGIIWGSIKSSNSDPQMVGAKRYIKTNSEKIYLRYLPGTAVVHNKGAMDGTHLPDVIFNVEKNSKSQEINILMDTLLGMDAPNGNIQGGRQYAGYIEYTIEAVERAGAIRQEVSYDGINYGDSIIASPGADIFYRVDISNIGNEKLTNVTVKGLLSKGLKLISESIMWSVDNSGIWETLQDDYFRKGINFGTVGRGNEICISYKCTVDEDMNNNDVLLSSAFLVYDSETEEGDQKEAVSIIHVSGSSITPWGPERNTFTWADPAPYVVFNSITDNPDVGDERNFVQIREQNEQGSYKDEVKVTAGKVYEVYLYFHNNASPMLADTSEGIARDVKVSSFFPRTLTTGKKYIVTSTISASNASPAAVWDGAYITADEDLVLQYIPGSLTLRSYTETEGQTLDKDEFFSEKGALISMHFDQPGVISLSDNDSRGHITYCLMAIKESQLMGLTLETSIDGKKWSDSVSAKRGDYVSFRASFKNNGYTLLTNAIVRCEFDNGLALRAGSTTVYDHDNIEGKKIDDIIDISGYNTGNKASGELTNIVLQGVVNVDKLLDGTSLTCSMLLEYNGKKQQKQSVTIKVVD